MKPNVKKYRPNDAAYMSRLRDRSQLSPIDWAEHMGVTERTARNYVTVGGFKYADQFLAEQLAVPA